ncbi:MAG: FKBP-type peptidyl-prolyl cis-trans isomerase [Blastomonas sp.]
MSVTRVPILPIEKGSLTKLWLGVGLAVALAGGAAWAGMAGVPQSAASFLAGNAGEDGVVTTETGLQFKELAKGNGTSPGQGDLVLAKYTGSFTDGEVFDSSERQVFPLTPGPGAPVPGFAEGLMRGSCGGKYRMWIPPELGYGEEGMADPRTGEQAIPKNAVLVFDIEIINFVSEQKLRQMQMEQSQEPPMGACGPLVP